MKFTDLNPGGGIGANCQLIELGPFRFVIDAGIHPKLRGKASLPVLSKIDAASLDFVILTHCHLDHLGALPVLMRDQPQAYLLMSEPSQILAPRMLHNSVNVMLRQREESGIADYPFYTHGEVERLRQQIVPMKFQRQRTFDLKGEELSVTFYPAGHIAGAAAVQIVYKGRRIFFTGDCLFTEQRILAPARFPHVKVDTLVTETTRGLTRRISGRSREEEVSRLLQDIHETLSNDGSVLLPVFALGRMQEVFQILVEARRGREIPPVTVYGSGLGMDLADYLDEITRKMGKSCGLSFRRETLKELRVRPLPEKFSPKRTPKEPAIYVLSSGMMVEQTPSYVAAAAFLGDARHLLAFVGYCDPDTPGGHLLALEEGERMEFGVLDTSAQRLARVERYDLSGHADREELRDFAVASEARAIVLSHGEKQAREWFSRELAQAAPQSKVFDPPALDTVEV